MMLVTDIRQILPNILLIYSYCDTQETSLAVSTDKPKEGQEHTT